MTHMPLSTWRRARLPARTLGVLLTILVCTLTLVNQTGAVITAPKNIVFSDPSPDHVTLTWDPPTSSYPVTNYEIEAVDAQTTDYYTSTSGPTLVATCRVAGLNTTYRVRATSLEGTGPWSEYGWFVLPTSLKWRYVRFVFLETTKTKTTNSQYASLKELRWYTGRPEDFDCWEPKVAASSVSNSHVTCSSQENYISGCAGKPYGACWMAYDHSLEGDYNGQYQGGCDPNSWWSNPVVGFNLNSDGTGITFNTPEHITLDRGADASFHMYPVGVFFSCDPYYSTDKWQAIDIVDCPRKWRVEVSNSNAFTGEQSILYEGTTRLEDQPDTGVSYYWGRSYNPSILPTETQYLLSDTQITVRGMHFTLENTISTTDISLTISGSVTMTACTIPAGGLKPNVVVCDTTFSAPGTLYAQITRVSDGVTTGSPIAIGCVGNCNGHTPPAVPTPVCYSPRGGVTLNVTWDEPTSTLPVSNYEVWVTDNVHMEERRVIGSSSIHESIHECLYPDRNYTVAVRAANPGGWGDWANVTCATSYAMKFRHLRFYYQHPVSVPGTTVYPVLKELAYFSAAKDDYRAGCHHPRFYFDSPITQNVKLSQDDLAQARDGPEDILWCTNQLSPTSYGCTNVFDGNTRGDYTFDNEWWGHGQSCAAGGCETMDMNSNVTLDLGVGYEIAPTGIYMKCDSSTYKGCPTQFWVLGSCTGEFTGEEEVIMFATGLTLADNIGTTGKTWYWGPVYSGVFVEPTVQFIETSTTVIRIPGNGFADSNCRTVTGSKTVTLSGSSSPSACGSPIYTAKEVICSVTFSSPGTLFAKVDVGSDSSGFVQIAEVFGSVSITPSNTDYGPTDSFVTFSGVDLSTSVVETDLTGTTVTVSGEGVSASACANSKLSRALVVCQFSNSGGGPIYVSVSRDLGSESAGPVLVGTVYPLPAVTAVLDLPVTATWTWIHGTNFTKGPTGTAGDVVVSLNIDGLSQNCGIAFVNISHINCTFNATSTGPVYASIQRTTDGLSSAGTPQIAVIHPDPAVVSLGLQVPVTVSTLEFLGSNWTYGGNNPSDVQVALSGALSGACVPAQMNASYIQCTGLSPSGVGVVSVQVTRLSDMRQSPVVPVLEYFDLPVVFNSSRTVPITNNVTHIHGTVLTYNTANLGDVIVQVAGDPVTGGSGVCIPTFVNATYVRCEYSRSNLPGTVNVTLIRSSDSLMVVALAHTVVPDPTVTSTPSLYLRSTITTLTFSGTSLTYGTTNNGDVSIVLSGTAGVTGACVPTSVSDSAVTCTFSAASNGTVVATLTRNVDGRSSAPTLIANLVPAPIIHPGVQTIYHSDPVVTLHGDDFLLGAADGGGVTVQLGGILSSTCTVNSVDLDRIVCTLPNSKNSGLVTATVTRNTDSVASSTVNIVSYIGPSIATAVYPSVIREGHEVQLEITLQSPPVGNVSLSITVSDPAINVTSPVELFSSGDWAPRNITVMYIEDDLWDGNRTATFNVSVATTPDPAYDGVVSLTPFSMQDNEPPSFSLKTLTPFQVSAGKVTENNFITFLPTVNVVTAVIVTAQDTSGFSEQPSISITSPYELTFNPDASANGVYTVDVRVQYNSTLLSASRSFAITLVGGWPEIIDVNPPRVSTLGGTSVTITGKNLGNVASELTGVWLCGVPCTQTVWSSSLVVQCVSAPAPGGCTTPDGVRVLVGTSAAYSPGNFTYQFPPQITSVTPSFALLTGKSVVTIRGSRLGIDSSDLESIRVGATPCETIVYTSDTLVSCTVPAAPVPAGTQITLRTRGGGASAGFPFQYVVPIVSSISPSTASKDGGTVVTLRGDYLGTSLGDPLNVTLNGNVLCSKTSRPNIQTVECTTRPMPENTTGSVVVSVSGTEGAASVPQLTFIYPLPEISTFLPASIGLSTDSVVTIQGFNFGRSIDYVTKVSLASIPCREVKFESSSILHCLPGTFSEPRTGPVVVTTTSGVAESTQDIVVEFQTQNGFLQPRPVIQKVSPNTGTMLGNTTVSITGEKLGLNASDVTQVTLAGIPCASVLWESSTLIQCVSGSRSSPSVGPVVVVTRSGSESRSSTTFTYSYPRPTLEGVFPRVGDYKASTKVTVVGQWFTTNANAQVTIYMSSAVTGLYQDNHPCLESRWLSETRLECLTRPAPPVLPAGDDGEWYFHAVVDGVRSEPVATGFRYVEVSLLCVPPCGYRGDCEAGVCECQPGYMNPPECSTPMILVASLRNYTSEDMEDGNAEIQVKLQAAPTSPVTIQAISTKPSEAMLLGTTLTFDAEDYSTAQQLLLRGIADTVRDGAQPYSVVFFPTESLDPRYSDVRIPDIHLVNLDSKPMISSVEPKISPLNGTNITLTGSNFDAEVSVELASQVFHMKDLRIVYKSTLRSSVRLLQNSQPFGREIEKIVLTTPRLDDGMYTLRVNNLERSSLNQQLRVTDDCPFEGMYGRGSDCRDCQRCEVCPGGYLRYPSEEGGCWGGTSLNAEVLPCDIPEACIGGPNSTCRYPYTGVRCSACSSGYFKSQAGTCEVCPEQSLQLGYLVAAIVMWLTVALAASVIEERENLSHLIVMILHFQVIGGVGSLVSHTAPKWMRYLYDFFILFTGDIVFLKPDCQGRIDYETNFLVNLGYAVGITVPFFGGVILSRFLSQISNQERGPEVLLARKAHYNQRLVRGFTIWGTLLYLDFTMRAWNSVICDHIDGKGFLLYADNEVKCFTSDHSTVFLVSILILVVFSIGFPAFQLWRQWRHKEDIAEGDPAFLHKWDFLFEPYREEYKYAWVIEFGIMFMIAVSEPLFSSQVHVQFPLLIAAFFAQSAFYALIRPFHRSWENPLMLGCSVTNLLVTLFIYLNSLNVMNVIFEKIYGYTLGILVGSIFLAFTYVVGYYIFWKWNPRTEYGHKNYYDEDEIGDGFEYEYYTPDGKLITDLIENEIPEDQRADVLNTFKSALKKSFSEKLVPADGTEGQGVKPYPDTSSTNGESAIDMSEAELEFPVSSNPSTGNSNSQDASNSNEDHVSEGELEAGSRSTPNTPVHRFKSGLPNALKRSTSVPVGMPDLKQSKGETEGDSEVQVTRSERTIVFHQEDSGALGLVGVDVSKRASAKTGVLVNATDQTVTASVAAALKRLSSAVKNKTPASIASHDDSYYTTDDESSPSDASTDA